MTQNNIWFMRAQLKEDQILLFILLLHAGRLEKDSAPHFLRYSYSLMKIQ